MMVCQTVFYSSRLPQRVVQDFHGAEVEWGGGRILVPTPSCRASQVALVAKNLPASVGDIKDTGLIPGLGRSPGEGNGNPLQYSCLENSMDRGA